MFTVARRNRKPGPITRLGCLGATLFLALPAQAAGIRLPSATYPQAANAPLGDPSAWRADWPGPRRDWGTSRRRYRFLWASVGASASEAKSQAEGHDSSSWYVGMRSLAGIRLWNLDLGITAEVGTSKLRFSDGVQSAHLSGQYWMAGPIVRWGLPTERSLKLETSVMTGFTASDQVTSVRMVRLAASYTFASGLRLAVTRNNVVVTAHDLSGLYSGETAMQSGTGLEVGYSF